MKKMLAQAFKLNVKKINASQSRMGDQYSVGDETVRIFTKPGRRLITCTCVNGTRFCNEPTICKHKIAVILYEAEE